MAKYSASGTQTLAASVKTALGLTSNATTPNRLWLYNFFVADQGTPADNVVIHTLQRITAAGTSTGVTPTKLDPADRAAQTVGGETHSAEPTYTSNEELLEIPINTRNTLQWMAAPGSELVAPATANNGFGWKSSHASAVTVWRVTALFQE
jgi:hypothetical protein